MCPARQYRSVSPLVARTRTAAGKPRKCTCMTAANGRVAASRPPTGYSKRLRVRRRHSVSPSAARCFRMRTPFRSYRPTPAGLGPPRLCCRRTSGAAGSRTVKASVVRPHAASLMSGASRSRSSRRTLRRHHCALGSVRGRRKHGSRSRVIRQSIRSGRTLPAGSKVAVTF